jgi:hypothetical protein
MIFTVMGGPYRPIPCRTVPPALDGGVHLRDSGISNCCSALGLLLNILQRLSKYVLQQTVVTDITVVDRVISPVDL